MRTTASSRRGRSSRRSRRSVSRSTASGRRSTRSWRSGWSATGRWGCGRGFTQKTEVDERFGKLFQNEDFAIHMQSEEFRRSYASGMGRGGAAHAESEEEREDEAMLQEDFDLLDEEDARGDTRKKTRNDANETSEDISDSEEEEAQPYVGRSGKKAREEQERIKPKVRFFGVKDSKVTIPTSRKEMKKEVEKRKERRTLSLGQRAKELEKKERSAKRS